MPSEEGANEVNQQDAVPAENKTETKTSPVKKTKPVKMRLYKVLLLDGTEYEVELDVSLLLLFDRALYLHLYHTTPR